jgi:hypothetical protein
MADKITAKNVDTPRPVHEAGQFVAKCVDVIDLGEKVQDYDPKKPKYLAPKCALVFRTGEKNPETGEYLDVSVEYTVSMGEKSNMRPFLEGWRGKAYTPAEADEGVPLDKLEGRWALIQIGHKTSKKDKPYAIIMTAMGVPKGMALPTFGPYERAKFWAERKAEYQKGADTYRDEIGINRDGTPINTKGRVTADESGGTGFPADDEPDGSFRGEDELPFDKGVAPF